MDHEGNNNDTIIRMTETGHDNPVKPFVGCVVRTPKGQKAVILRVNEKSVSGLFLYGKIDCMYRYCNLVEVKTRTGFRYRNKSNLKMLGFIKNRMLWQCVDDADSNKSFGNGEYHYG
jgi:hypothetical protein